MRARQIRTFTRNAETLYSSQYRNIIIIANARETVKCGILISNIEYTYRWFKCILSQLQVATRVYYKGHY